jgi:hypothetical protein
MTEHERNPEAAKQVSQRYRELGAEEPPRALDAAILAAAHRESGARPAPLVSPGARRTWYLPLAAAAVIMLSVAVTVHMQQEQPDLDVPQQRAKKTELAAVPAPAAPSAQPTPAPQLAPPVARAPGPPTVAEAARRGIVAPAAKEEVASAEKPFTPDPPAAARAEITAAERAAPASAPAHPAAPAPAARAPAAASAPLVAPAERQEARAMADAAGKPASNVGAVAGAAAPPAGRSDAREELQRRELTPRARAVEARDKLAQEPETPEKWLERIATLRAEGRHGDADKALAEFRQRHPDYRIPEPMLHKVLPAR